MKTQHSQKKKRFGLILDHTDLGTECVIVAQEGTVDVDGKVHRSKQGVGLLLPAY